MTLSFPVSFKIIAGNEAQSQDHNPRQNADQGKETQVGINSMIHFDPTCTYPFAELDQELSPRIESEFLD